ncbi:MAG: 2-oxoglutarate dehydrogenase E1 component [Longimicrobiales bacterium]
MSPNVFDMYNAAYVQAMFDQYLQNPGSVDATWRRLFETEAGTSGLMGAVVQVAPSTNGSTATPATQAPPPAAPAPASAPPSTSAAAGAGSTTIEQLRAARAAGELVDAYRLHGHRAARIDPLGSKPPGHPALDPAFHGITEAALHHVPIEVMDGLPSGGTTVADAIEFMKQTYTGTIGYEYEHIEDPEPRNWLREQIESGAHRQTLSADEKKHLLNRLTEVEAFEQFLHRSYLGAKRFSIEGNDMMVPMLDVAIERAAADGAREIAIGMAHRGRLNVLAHVIGMPYVDLLAKFEGHHTAVAGTGDVKYHIGAEGTYATRSGEPLNVILAPNPSHLEFVHPVVVGMTRAKQSDRSTNVITRDGDAVVPIIIHGDAAFAGQGVVPETLNMSQLRGYAVGGTLHIIANNQVGFTTTPSEGRSTDYSSDVARGYDVPVFHVNADDPEACLAVARLAMAYRAEFHGDVVIDLIGYRRFGHNEADEPMFTQPTMYNAIGAHPTVRAIFGGTLAAAGVIAEADVAAILKQANERLIADQAIAKEPPEDHEAPDEIEGAGEEQIDTKVSEALIDSLDRQLHGEPEVEILSKLAKTREKRSKQVQADASIEWAHAEALAFGSLLADGVFVRMTGQDVQRGTFSQRHLVLHDSGTNEEYMPIANLKEAKAPIEIWNSPLSELAVMGFEYGYSVSAPKALVLWEGQFGDFANGAQIIIDQFITAGRAKWGQESRLALLLPHGYEGQGPEHSSARFERFLQMCAENNMRVANCTTPANYFHLLRRQALHPSRRPLIVMTPKSLLRHPRAVSPVAELSTGGFMPVLDDTTANAASIDRVVLTTGKLHYDLADARDANDKSTALVRVEMLYPFPAAELKAVLARYPQAEEIVWAQEEPRNMGAWPFIESRMGDVTDIPVRYAGRPPRASPAEGYVNVHEAMQKRIVTDALRAPVSADGKAAAKPARSRK